MLRVNSFSGMLTTGTASSLLRTLSSFLIKRNNSTETVTQVISQEWENAKPYKDMPGPKPIPVLGNNWRLLPRLGDIPTDFSKMQHHFHSKYGKISKLSNFANRDDMVFVFDPNEIEKVFRNEGKWPFRESLKSIEYYRTVTRKDVFDGVGGSVVNQGEEWQTFRSKVNPTMMQPRATKIYVAPIDAVASDFIKRIRLLKDEKQEMPSDFKNELYKWALESIVYIALDTRLGCLNEDIESDSEPQKVIDSIQVLFGSIFKMEFMPSLWKVYKTRTWKNFVKASDYCTEVAVKYIDQAIERLQALPKDSERELTILEKLLAQDSNPKTAMVMALDMIFAGVDTTSNTLAILLYFLAKNPEKQQKLFEEIKQYLPDKNQPVTSEILNELKYLKACSKESMRMKPVAIANVRKLPKDLVLSEYRVPKGTDVVIPHLYLCSMEKYFPQADKFIPERWLKNKDGTAPDTKMTHPFVYLPFGFGPRMCLGRRFAELEMETMATKIVRNFHIEYNYDEMKYQSALLYVPASPLKFKFVDRT